MKKEATATYQWQGDGVIQRVDIRTQDNGRAVAYVFADDSNHRQPERNAVRVALRGKGWGTLSDHTGDQFSLRVSGITNPQDLIRLITEQGYVSGSPAVTNTTPEVKKSKGVVGFIKDNSLQISAIVYTIGNALYFASGFFGKVVKKNKNGNKTGEIGRNTERMGMASAFAIGDAALGIYGGNDDARQYKALLSKLKTHMEGDGIDIPRTASIHVETAALDEGIGGRFRDFMHTHINSIKMMAEVVGGFFAFRGGVKNNKPWEKWGGIIVMGGWAGALLTKEKKPDKEKLQNAGTVEKAVAWVQEKPLRLAGLAGLAFNGVGAKNYYDEGGKSGILGGGAVGTMVGANLAYAISHKAPGGNIKEDAMVSDVYGVAAQIINKLPELQREAAMQSTAKFLGERPEIKDTHSEIIERLNKEVLIQRKNPWFENTRLAIRPMQETAPEHKHHHHITADTEVAHDKKETPGTAIVAAGSSHEAKIVLQPAISHEQSEPAL